MNACAAPSKVPWSMARSTPPSCSASRFWPGGSSSSRRGMPPDFSSRSWGRTTAAATSRPRSSSGALGPGAVLWWLLLWRSGWLPASKPRPPCSRNAERAERSGSWLAAIPVLDPPAPTPSARRGRPQAGRQEVSSRRRLPRAPRRGRACCWRWPRSWVVTWPTAFSRRSLLGGCEIFFLFQKALLWTICCWAAPELPGPWRALPPPGPEGAAGRMAVRRHPGAQ